MQQQELFRFLVHNTTLLSYAVCSVLCFVNEGSKTIEDYHNSLLCRCLGTGISVFFGASLATSYCNNELLSQVRNVPTYCKRVDNCLACREKVVNVNVLLWTSKFTRCASNHSMWISLGVANADTGQRVYIFATTFSFAQNVNSTTRKHQNIRIHLPTAYRAPVEKYKVH